MLIVILFFPSNVFASIAGEVNKANDLYKQGKFDDSLDLYQKALDQNDKLPAIKYDLGTALYKKGDYTKAYGYLEEAAHDKNVKINSKAEYNLGNVLYKSGKQKENTNVDQAIKSLQEALGQYVQVVRDDPKDADAKFNQNIVRKEIERLKKKKQQQQQNKGQKQNQQQQQNQKQQQNQQSQQNQQKQQENQKKQNTQAQAEQNQKELDRKQAEDLLEEYQENEEPKKLLNYMPKKIDDRPVLKDW